MAVWLGLADKPRKFKELKNFDVEFSDEIKSVTIELNITAQSLKDGNLLMNLPLPDKTVAVMVKRDNKYFVPTGKTALKENDKLLIITDNHEGLIETMKSMGTSDAAI
jgi:cell volume regulation protein A